MRTIVIFVILLNALFLACSTLPPERDFEVTLYKIDWESRCLVYKNNSDEIKTICYDDTPEEEMKLFIGIHIEDGYKKERNYQEILIRQCKTWR